MAGLLTPENGQVVSLVPPLFLPQTPVILSGSVLKNAAFGLRLQGVNRRSAQERAGVWLEAVGLGNKSNLPATVLSGGERRRLALARVLACAAPLILLDEPTAELDPANVSRIEKVLSDFRAEGGSIVLVSHNLFQARRLADRCLMIWNGQAIDDLPTNEFFMAPRDPRTQSFLVGEVIY
jgi:tungstate transport system ATP-binding protein